MNEALDKGDVQAAFEGLGNKALALPFVFKEPHTYFSGLMEERKSGIPGSVLVSACVVTCVGLCVLCVCVCVCVCVVTVCVCGCVLCGCVLCGCVLCACLCVLCVHVWV